MKVLYVITKSERGGAQVHLVDLLASLPSDYESVVVTGARGYLTEEARKLGVPSEIVPELVHHVSPLKDLAALRALAGVIRREMPDLVHVHTSKAGLLGRLAAALTGTPAVFTAHTWSFADGISWKEKWFAPPVERLAAFACGKIINVSQANVHMALSRSIGSRKRLVCIWNGVPDVAPRANPGTGPVTTLLMSARFVPQKDHLLLIEALTGVEGRWRLLLAGDGPGRKQVSDEVRRHGLGGRVQFIGERNDIPELLARADVFVLATKWEGLPLCILEAMRAGLPVIASGVGGVSEAVTDGLSGYVTPPHDALALRTRLQALVSSKELQRSMGQAGRRRYEQDFRIETMMQKTIAVYHEVAWSHRDSVVESPVAPSKAFK